MTRIKQIQDFEEMCREHGFEYDFEKKNGYYRNWQTGQAFALYALAIEKGEHDAHINHK